MLDPRYTVNGYEPEGGDGAIVFTFVPGGSHPERGPGGLPKRVPRFVVTVRGGSDGLVFDWSGSPDDPGATGTEIQADIQARMRERGEWIGRVTELVEQVDAWARKLGWATRRLEKKLDDARVGSHRVPALILQADLCRIMLEPVGRSAPGAEGVVDLYSMPAYDDIASIYYSAGQWNLHFPAPGHKPVASIREAGATRLSEESFATVLAEMKRNAS